MCFLLFCLVDRLFDSLANSNVFLRLFYLFLPVASYIEAYGLSNNDLVRKIARAQFPSQIEAKVGAYVSTKHPDGGMLEAVITKVTEDAVTLDANHPLAGKALTFEIELLDIA